MQWSQREQELYRMALENSKLETKLATLSDQPIPEAPVFRPSAEEFRDPLRYVASIRKEAEAFGICKIVPPVGWKVDCAVDWSSQKKFATKRQRLHELGEGQPFGDGRNYTLEEYQRMAKAFYERRCAKYPDLKGDALLKRLEADYWDIVDRDKEQVAVEYGNDIDINEYWSGFPRGVQDADELSTQNLPQELSDKDYVAKSGWNLNNTARWPGSLLRRHDAPLPGVTQPWLYLGMLFATFPWHNEDNYLESINYHHAGAPKQWYGIPGTQASTFEDVVRRFHKQRLLEVPDLLHRINLQISPAKLAALDVPVHRVLQRPGEFVVTFPQAFHGGFSYGFNCGEAVNFATPDWVSHARLANERYRRVGRLAVVSHDRLMFTLRANEERDALDDSNRRILREELRRLVVEDMKLRDAAYASGVRDISKLCTPPANKTECINAAACDYDDKRICVACQHTCFLSAVGCECSRTDIVCLRHVAYACSCPSSMKYMIEWEGRPQLEALLVELNNELGPLPKKGAKRHLDVPGGAQVAEDRGLEPPARREQEVMASALATPRLP
jgi:histone demethylase JARID1